MKFIAVSKDEVRRKVALYFHDTYGTPLSQLKGSTDVRKMHPYNAKSWAELANVFNKFPWMEQLNVLLSPRDMHKYRTIDDLTGAIWSQLQKVVLIETAEPTVELSAVARFDAASSKPRSTGKRSKKAKPKSTRRKSAPKRGRSSKGNN